MNEVSKAPLSLPEASPASLIHGTQPDPRNVLRAASRRRGGRARLAIGMASACALTLAACGPSPTGGGSCDFVAGDLVVTEVMANPAGEDKGNEWFEVYNATSMPLDLSGLRLVASRADGTGEKVHAVKGNLLPPLAPGAYVVFGDVAPDMRPPHVAYGYGSSLGALRNDDGRIALRCGQTVVDELSYGAMDSGVATGLSGPNPPDSIANDDLTNLCGGLTEFLPGSFGTPGEPNDDCGGGPTPTTCDDNGTVRDIVAPEEGDLVITEVMPNPSKVDDAVGEWFEVYVARDVDLNGLELGPDAGAVRDVVTDATCLRAAAGTHIVFARAVDPAVNGGLPTVAGRFSFGLTNSGGSISIGRGGQVLDSIAWATSHTGATHSLDPDAQTPTANDDPTSFCKATSPYGAGDLGTPGKPNAQCPTSVPPGMCLEGGSPRPIEVPAVGDLVITEVLANPMVVADTSGEWFEVHVARDVDLNGLELGSPAPAVDLTLGATECLRATAGTVLVFARSDDPAVNGGLPVVDYVHSFALANSSSGLFLGYAGTILDAVTWSSTTDGASMSLDPDATTPADNDIATNFCPATTPYGAGDKGSPGEQNSQCP